MSDNSILSVMIQSAANSPANPVYKKDLTPLISNLMDLNSAPAPYTPPYKVYTALLAQSGGDDPQTITSGNLTIGVTYMMDGITLTTDFTNVGAPYNANGVYFVATGTTPNNWGGADLNYNTGAPIVTVLENTIGNIWFTYVSTGSYTIYSSNLFTDDKTTAFIGTGMEGVENSIFTGLAFQSPNNIRLSTVSFDVTTFVGINEELYRTPIEIRVYN